MVRLIFIFLLLSASNLYPQKVEPITTDRPDQTESAFTVPAGHFQAEIGFVFEKHTFEEEISQNTIAVPSILLRYAILPGAELRAELEHLHIYHSSGINERNENGLGPLTIGTKIKICDEKGLRPETAFIFHLTIPNTGAKVFQSQYTAPSFRFTMQNGISRRFSLSYNLGQEWDGLSVGPVNIYTLSVAYSAAEKIGLFIESYGFLANGERPDHRVDGGLTYLIKNNLQADISAGLGITELSPDFFIGAGFSIRLPK